MSLPLLGIGVILLLAVGYRLYGRLLARWFGLDAGRTTPAVTHADGVDFVPTKPFYLAGQHFAAIAAAGPIAGPILAGQQFGWGPCLLWIAFGVIFIGAVHDMSTLVASVRHDAKSIAEVVRAHIGYPAFVAIVLFIYLALIYVIVAFVDITANTFVSGDKEFAGLALPFNQGGAVSLSTTMYLGLAVSLGFIQRFTKTPLWLLTIIFVPATLVAVWLGTQYSQVFAVSGPNAVKIWGVAILGYCLIAALSPMWALLQPRGYLGGFVLYLALGAGIIGLFFGGFEIKSPAFSGFSFTDPKTGASTYLFPFLFVTIACGACSGFHGLVCSGTTSKQIEKETHCGPVGYGSMLLEALVAVIALATLMIAGDSAVGKPAGAIYGEGLGKFVAVIIGEKHLLFAVTFGAMAFSTFVLDTIDCAARLGRYLLQELFNWRGKTAAFFCTLVTCALPAAILLTAEPKSYMKAWLLFGTSNQLLAALSLLGIAVWLKKEGKRYLFVLLPMMFLLVVTMTALYFQLDAGRKALSTGNTTGIMNGAVALTLTVLATALVYMGVKKLCSKNSSDLLGR